MTDREILAKLGTKICKLREEQHLSTENFAEKCGLGHEYLKALEAGHIDAPTPVLINIIKNLSVSIDVFFKDIDFS